MILIEQVECPHCHAKVMPKSRLSTFVFVALLILGLLPFVLNVAGILNTLGSLRALSGESSELSMLRDIIPQQVIEALGGLVISFGLLWISHLVLSLVLGVIPAVIYLAFRHGSYKCPTCNLPIS